MPNCNFILFNYLSVSLAAVAPQQLRRPFDFCLVQHSMAHWVLLYLVRVTIWFTRFELEHTTCLLTVKHASRNAIAHHLHKGSCHDDLVPGWSGLKCSGLEWSQPIFHFYTTQSLGVGKFPGGEFSYGGKFPGEISGAENSGGKFRMPFITARTDYCRSLPVWRLRCLDRILHSAARISGHVSSHMLMCSTGSHSNRRYSSGALL